MPSGQARTSDRCLPCLNVGIVILTRLPFLRVALQGLKKTIPGSPEGQVPVHEKKSPVFTRVQK